MILYDLLSDHNVHQGAWHCVAVKHVFSKWNVLQDTQQSIVQYLPYEIGAHVFHSRTHNSTNLWSVNKISQGTWINHSPFFYFNHLYFLNTSSLYYDNHKGAYISWFQTFKVFQPLFFYQFEMMKNSVIMRQIGFFYLSINEFYSNICALKNSHMIIVLLNTLF